MFFAEAEGIDFEILAVFGIGDELDGFALGAALGGDLDGKFFAVDGGFEGAGLGFSSLVHVEFGDALEILDGGAGLVAVHGVAVVTHAVDEIVDTSGLAGDEIETLSAEAEGLGEELLGGFEAEGLGGIGSGREVGGAAFVHDEDFTGDGFDLLGAIAFEHCRETVLDLIGEITQTDGSGAHAKVCADVGDEEAEEDAEGKTEAGEEEEEEVTGDEAGHGAGVHHLAGKACFDGVFVHPGEELHPDNEQ